MKLTENFITNSIDQKSKQVIGSLEKSNETNITQALANIKALEQSLTLYKNALKDFCDLSVEKGQLLAKYSKDTTGQSYNLPGVFASSYGGYDIQQMKQDNERIQEILSLLEQAENQKDMYFKMIQNAQNNIMKELNQVAKNSVDIEAFLAQLEDFTSWQSNQQKK